MARYKCPVCEKVGKNIREDTISAEIMCKQHGKFIAPSRKRLSRPIRQEAT